MSRGRFGDRPVRGRASTRVRVAGDGIGIRPRGRAGHDRFERHGSLGWWGRGGGTGAARLRDVLRLRLLGGDPEGGSGRHGAPDVLALDSARPPHPALRACRRRDRGGALGQGPGDDPRPRHPDLLRQPADGGDQRRARGRPHAAPQGARPPGGDRPRDLRGFLSPLARGVRTAGRHPRHHRHRHGASRGPRPGDDGIRDDRRLAHRAPAGAGRGRADGLRDRDALGLALPLGCWRARC